MEASGDKNLSVDRESATGLTFQELAQKNRLDERLEARVAEIVRVNCGESDAED